MMQDKLICAFYLVEHTEKGVEEVWGPMKFSGPAQKLRVQKLVCAHAKEDRSKKREKRCLNFKSNDWYKFCSSSNFSLHGARVQEPSKVWPCRCNNRACLRTRLWVFLLDQNSVLAFLLKDVFLICPLHMPYLCSHIIICAENRPSPKCERSPQKRMFWKSGESVQKWQQF